MMTNVTISERWYNELKGLVKMENAYIYKNTDCSGNSVEVDVNEKEFEKISKKLGWI